MESKNIYYLGIWNSEKWKEAEKLLNQKYDIQNYKELFSLDGKFRPINSLEIIIQKYEKFIIDFFLPILQSIAYSSQNIKKEIPILLDNCKEKIELTQFECASILSTFFLNMYGNETEGRNEDKLKKLNYELDLFPDLSFDYYLNSKNKLIINKMLFMIRYFIKIGIRMAISKKLKFVEHAKFLSSPETILEKVKEYKAKIKNIYDFDKEFKIDCDKERNSILKIYLNEFNPKLINKDFELKPIDNNKMSEKKNEKIEPKPIDNKKISEKKIEEIEPKPIDNNKKGEKKKEEIEPKPIDNNKIGEKKNEEIEPKPIDIQKLNQKINEEIKQTFLIQDLLNSNEKENKIINKIIENVFLNQQDKISLDYLENKIKIHLNSITEQKNNIITNFANKYLGGGCMHLGSVQEEILLLICPEILVARAFVKKMNHTQSISMSGFEIISKSKGYGNSLEYDTYNIDDTPYENNSFKSLMIAVDAIPFYGIGNNSNQFMPILIMRELIKFITGLQGNRIDVLGFKYDFCSTGKWGCGAFGGNVYLKFLIQFIGCLFCDVGFNFSCFNDKKNEKIFNEFIKNLKDIFKKNKDKITKGLMFKAFINMEFTSKSVKDIMNLYINTLKSYLK